jgi:hypothetical protein
MSCDGSSTPRTRETATDVATDASGSRGYGDGAEKPWQRRRSYGKWRSLSGQWVAIKDDDIIHASSSPRELVGWLGQHGQKADTMFRVPEDDLAITGLAPV